MRILNRLEIKAKNFKEGKEGRLARADKSKGCCHIRKEAMGSTIETRFGWNPKEGRERIRGSVERNESRNESVLKGGGRQLGFDLSKTENRRRAKLKKNGSKEKTCTEEGGGERTPLSAGARR